MEDIITKMEEIFKNVLDDTITDIDLFVSLSDLNINSISFIKLVIAIENEFNITFDDEYLNNAAFNSVNDIVIYVANRMVKN